MPAVRLAVIHFLIAFLGLLLICFPTALFAEQLTAPAKEGALGQNPLSVFEPPEQQELILQIIYKRWLMSEGLIGYQIPGGVLLPLGEITRVLEFAIKVSPEAGQAEGWVLTENRTFYLDVPNEEVVINGKVLPLDTSRVAVKPDDIYVDSTLLNEWFPVKLDFSLSRLLVSLTTTIPLPFEGRIKREGKRKGLARRKEKVQYPRMPLPYRFFDLPALDLSYSTTYNKSKDQKGSTSGSYTAVFGGDLFFMSSNFFLGGNHDDPVTGARWTLQRIDPEGGLLGPLRLTEISLGDVFSAQIPLLTTSTAGAGMVISNFPVFQQAEFDRTNLRGELPQGWEVELYRNEILLALQRSRADGRYEFLDVPLLFGKNDLRLIFYGPQGQKRENIQSFQIGHGQLRPDQHNFRIGSTLGDVTLFDLTEGTPQSRQNLGDIMNYFAEYQVGLTRSWSMGAVFASTPGVDERVYSGGLDLRGSILGALSRLNGVIDSEGGAASEFATQTNIFGVGVFGSHRRSFNFSSQRVTSDLRSSRQNRSNLRLNFAIPEFLFVPRIPVALTGIRDEQESGLINYTLTNRLSMYFGGLNISNNMNWSWFRGEGPTQDPDTLGNGNFLLNIRLLGLSLRGGLTYNIHPVAEPISTSFTTDFRLGRGFSTRATVLQSLTDDKVTTVTAGLNQRFDSFAFGISGTWDSEDNFSVGASLTFSLGWDTLRNRPIMMSDRLATSGSASARVFLDQNQNGTYDEGDEPLEGIQFSPGRRDQKTDEEGILFIPRLSSFRPTAVNVKGESLEDPFWVLIQEGIELVPHPGRSTILEFPVIPTGEVDGTVFLNKMGTETEVSRVLVQLIDIKGEVIQEVATAYDGFYLFTYVIPGKYILRVNPDQVERLNLKTSPQQEVVITGEGNVESGRDIVLEIRSETPAGSQAPKAPPGNIPAPETESQEAPVPEAPQLAIPQRETPAQETESPKP